MFGFTKMSVMSRHFCQQPLKHMREVLFDQHYSQFAFSSLTRPQKLLVLYLSIAEFH
jgi:hypothetical protein